MPVCLASSSCEILSLLVIESIVMRSLYAWLQACTYNECIIPFQYELVSVCLCSDVSATCTPRVNLMLCCIFTSDTHGQPMDSLSNTGCKTGCFCEQAVNSTTSLWKLEVPLELSLFFFFFLCIQVSYPHNSQKAFNCFSFL